MSDLKETKLESLAKLVDLNQKDITDIKISKRRQYLSKINPIYWFGQVLIFLISLFYSITIGNQKRNAIYPFESWVIPLFLAPFPLSVHLMNMIYSITGEERSRLSKRVRVLVFFINLSIFAFLFYVYYVSLPKVYYSNVAYGVFDARGTRRISIEFL